MKLLKMMFRILFAPVELVLRLVIGLLAFVVSISTTLLSIAASFFVFMAVLMFITNSIQNGLIYLLLALLISPIGCVRRRNCAAKPAKLSIDSAEIELAFRRN